MPFITEEIYQENFKKTEKDKSIHISKWPEYEKEKDAKELDLFIEILGKIRQEKTNNKKAMNAEIILTISEGEMNKLAEMLEDLKDVSNAKEIRAGKFGVGFA